MRVWRKLTGIALALMMVLAFGAVASATTADLTNGEVGGYTTPDTPVTTIDKSVNIQKEITVFNPDESMVYGPAITYTYTVSPASGSELVTITDDDTTDHSNGVSVISTAQAGILENVTVNSGTAGTSTSTEVTGTLAWTNTDILDAGSSGVANYKNVVIDFTNVVFTAPGVYRYKITETSSAYATAGVIDGNGDSVDNIRYLDVYVMRGDSYTNGTTSAQWQIYGYVCVESGTTAITTASTKTNGFINSASSGTNADQYRTYNLTVKKTLVGDSSMENNKFPFAVVFANSTKTGTFQLIAEKDSDVTATTSSETATTTLGNASISSLLKIGSADTLANFNVSDIAVAHDNTIKFIGIPNGTTVTVTETNNVVGTTYTTSATQTVGTGTPTDAVFTTVTGSGTIATDTKSVSIDYNEKANYAQTAATTDDTNVLIEFTNNLAIISPTGVTLRYAPYLAMMGAGIVALPLSLRKKEELD